MSRKVLIANEMIADGELRQAGKICTLEDATADYLISVGKGRAPTEDEIARLGVAGDEDIRGKDKPAGKVASVPAAK